MTSDIVAAAALAAFFLLSAGLVLLRQRGQALDPKLVIVYALGMTPETAFVYEHPRAPWLRSDGYRLLCRRCKLVEAFELDPRGIEAAALFSVKHQACPAPAVAA